jgi:hypothetical protein
LLDNLDDFAKGHSLHFSVIPAKAGIQYIQYVLDAPVSSTGQAYQVRHDDSRTFCEVDNIVPSMNLSLSKKKLGKLN